MAIYLGKVCPKHGTRERFSNDGNCTICMHEYVTDFLQRRSQQGG